MDVRKIHYHSDCPFFAGCENMLANFFNSSGMHEKYDVSFSYRYSENYQSGLEKRVSTNFTVFPLLFSDPDYMSWMDNVFFKKIKIISIPIRTIVSVPVVIRQLFVLTRLFNKVRPDILHINNGGYPAALSCRVAVIAAKLAKIPVIIMVVNNLAVDYKKPIRWIDYPFDRLIAKYVDRFVTGSTSASKQLKRVLASEKSKYNVIHNGISIRKLTEESKAVRRRLGIDDFDGVVLGVVAILRPNKGHKVLLEAMSKLISLYKVSPSSVKLMIEGVGPLENDLKSYVENTNLTECCSFIGSEKNIMDFISIVDVLVLPSVSNEDFPNVILEAMALGKPVIASRLAGTPEQIENGETGILVPKGDSGKLADAIFEIYRNENFRKKMAISSKKRFDALFTAKYAVNNYQKLYDLLLES